MNIKISVIVPVYNVEKYLNECLDSIINQTLKDIEIICVNDGSTDNSLHILKEYAKSDNRIILIEQANQGAGVARNAGMKAAVGEFIAFMDPDDMYPNTETLSDLYNKAKLNNALICGGSLICLRGEKLEETSFKKAIFTEEGLMQYRDYQFDYYYQRFIYNREFLLKADIWFPPYRRYQDVPFFIKSMAEAKEFYRINDYTYCYRTSNNTKTTDEIKVIDMLKGIELSLMLSKSYGFDDLYCETVKRINGNYFVDIFKKATEISEKVIAQLIQTLRQVDKIFVKKYHTDFVPNNFYNQFTLSEPVNNLSGLFDMGKKDEDQDFVYKDNVNDGKQHMKPMISVIIPVYNVAKYLKQCLDSVINQTYDNLEIICVNDGSTDNSPEILEEYGKIDKRIKIINQKNKGLSGARNTGIDAATGEFITFLDSDDWLELNMLEELYRLIIATDTDMSFCAVNRFNDQTGAYAPESYFLLNAFVDYENMPLSRESMYKLIFNLPVMAWGKLIRASIIKENNIKFIQGMYFEDNVYFFELLFKLKNFSLTRQKLINYRVNRSDSVIASGDERFLDVIKQQKIKMDILLENSIFKEVERNFWAQSVTLFNKRYEEIRDDLKPLFYSRFRKFLKERYPRGMNNALDLIASNSHSGFLNSFSNKLPLIQIIFSIRNEDNHKIIRVLGIKFKIKKKANSLKRTEICILNGIKAYLIFPWYAYKSYKILSSGNTNIKIRKVSKIVKSFFLFPLYIYKTYKLLKG